MLLNKTYSFIKRFLYKSLSLFRLGDSWFSGLISNLVEAGRSISYFETMCPSKADTLHKDIKNTDLNHLKRSFEFIVRLALKKLKFSNVKIAIDVTEEPYWGKNGSYNTRAKVHEKSSQSWQFITVAIVDPEFFPLMSIPYRQIDNLDDLTIELLEYVKTLPLKIDGVLFDRGFFHWRLIDYLENKRGKKPLPYLILVPKNKRIKDFIDSSSKKVEVFEHKGKYSKDKSVWKPKTKIVIYRKFRISSRENAEINWTFATNIKSPNNLIKIYKKRWNIETGFRIHDEAKVKSKSSNILIRFFYHLFSMALTLDWKFSRVIQKKEFQKLIKLKPYQRVRLKPFKRFLKELVKQIMPPT